MRNRRYIEPSDHAQDVVSRFSTNDLIKYVVEDLTEHFSDMGEWEYMEELSRWYDD